MEKIKQVATQHQDKFKFLFLSGAGIAAFNTLSRPDFNLVVYLYVYYVWNLMTDSKETQASEKINCFFIMIYSLLIDIVWALFWGNRWGGKNDYESTIHGLVLFFSWIAILLKVITLVAVGVIEWGSIKSSLPAKLQERLNAGGNYQEQRDEI